ncbi:YpoC family protein [Neobacillus vireti]|uniref:YpoC-like domain-containing protein n=1 Tax=Neobacillus vireti LMG 21834 TaxID=1131730 RepID=A0AB94IHX0_9BACI|nr:hypothetical protein [Neobacillus vireti]ETI66633.1 hypothetical protein BAVI_21763 [Neobacillus vireti LMG 21834]KLT17197.1 hypothetical protein AA980_15030 [Neobacillus vireti]
MVNQEREVSELLAEWSSQKEQLKTIFHERNPENSRELMEHGIQLFVRFLFLSNSLHLSFDGRIFFSQLEIKPVNIEERLAFIKSRPSLYHSFRQLSELMVEQEKLFVKHRAMKKSSRPKA